MSKIKQARAWLAKKERTDSSEKKGDITIQKIAITAVAIILVGIVAAVLILALRSTGDDVAERAAGVGGEPAAFSAGCEVRNVRPSGYIQVRNGDAGAAANLRINFGANGVVTGTEFNASAAAVAANNWVAFGGTAADNDLATFSPGVTERRLNADLNGDGILSDMRVLAAVHNNGTFRVGGGANVHDDIGAASATDININVAAGTGRRLPVIVVPPTVGTPAANPLAANAALRINTADNCWTLAA